MTTVDRRLPTALYVQLERALLKHVRQLGLKAGDRLPTENEIARTYGVSRQTVRQALTRLVADGYVERVQGLGSFVAKPRPSHQSLLTSFTQNMNAQGFHPQRHLLRTDVVDTMSELEGFSDTPTGPLQYVLRLLLVDGLPLATAETWLHVDALGGRLDLFNPETLESSSLYELLQGPEIGLRIARGVETVRAGSATEEQSVHLRCQAGGTVLVVRRVSFTPSNNPVEWTVMTFVADRYEYTVELNNPN